MKNGKTMPMSEEMDAEMETEKDDPKYGKYDEWEIESAARTLKEAEEIKADTEKMKYVKMCMEHEMGEMKKAYDALNISSTDDIRKARQKLPS